MRALALLGITGTLLLTGSTLVVTSAGILSQGAPQALQRARLASCQVQVDAGPVPTTLNGDQLANAEAIVRVGRELAVPGRGIVIALATAMQESTLRNVNYGDDAGPDSRGLFQQRDPWGPLSERMDPAGAARLFFAGGHSSGTPGLLDLRGWESMPLTVAAQSVQRSAFPDAYAKWETLATALAASFQVAGTDRVGCRFGDLGTLAAGLDADGNPILADDLINVAGQAGAVGNFLRAALAQQGDPYVWGAVGPDAFDCSGLVVYAWRQAGYRLRIRVADEMYRNSARIPAGAEQPGDLLFGDFSNGVAGHVMIVVKPGLAVQAPHTGDVVRLTRYSADKWRIGRLRTTVMTPIR